MKSLYHTKPLSTLLLLVCLSCAQAFAQTKPKLPYTQKKVALGQLCIPLGSKLQEEKVPLKGIMASIFNNAKYYLAIEPNSSLTVFAYDFEFKKVGMEYDLKGGVSGMADEMAASIPLTEVRKTNHCDTNWCFFEGVYLFEKDTMNMTIKAHLGNKYLSVYGVIAYKKQNKLQRSLMAKTSLAAGDRNVIITEEESRLVPDTNEFGIVYLPEGEKLLADDIALTGLMANLFAKCRYYYHSNTKNDLNIFVYDYRFKKPGDPYNLEGGLGAITKRLGELLSLTEVSNKIEGDNYQANSDGIFVNEQQDTFRMIFKAVREQNYMTLIGTLCPPRIEEVQQSIMSQSVLYGMNRKKEEKEE